MSLPEISLEELLALGPLWDEGPACEFCGCSEFDACPGGCYWSAYFLERGRAICSNCEAIAAAMEVNSRTLKFWRSLCRSANENHDRKYQ